jgi:hypothetical protein
MKRLPFAAFLVAFALLASSVVQAAAGPARTRLNAFAQGLHALSGNFSQTLTDPNGKTSKTSSGTLVLEAPHQFRWDTLAPYKQTIVADGSRVWLYDPDLEQVTVRKQSSEEAQSPLTVLTDLSQLDKDFKVTGLYSRIRGKTAFWSADTAGRYGAGGLNKPMGVLDINPDKFAAAATWNFLPDFDATLGFTTLFSRHISGSDTRAYDGARFSYAEQTNGYTLFDLGGNYDLGKHGKLSLGVENLFNRQYILSWSQLAGYQNYWAGRGRMPSLTYTVTL